MSQEDDGVRIPNPKLLRIFAEAETASASYFIHNVEDKFSDCGDRILKEMQLKASSKVSRGKEVSPSSSGGSVNINRNENFGVDDDDMDCDLDCVPEDDVCVVNKMILNREKEKIEKKLHLDRCIGITLTTHFIDDDWKLQKRILNFCPISGHKSEEVGLGVEKCLLDWGIDKVFTVTVDNASSNDGAILYLQKKFDNWGTNILGGKYVHMRCIAHIVNLIVQDGLRNKEEHLAISRIRGAIRWNSTYLMLEAATCLKRAFSRYEDLDFGYTNDLSKPPHDGVPVDYDWHRASLLLNFLEHFYKLTLSISGSLYVTSNNIYHQICAVDLLLKQWLESDDFELCEMSKRMKQKFDKYWGSIEKMNMVIYYAVILDPRYKLEYIEFSFDTLYEDVTQCLLMKEKVKIGMVELFNTYKGMHESLGSSISSSKLVCKNDFKSLRPGDVVKSELDKYLGEDLEVFQKEFDILNWWKVNSHRFPILSKIARDILAVPVSTVASESAFSTGGRVLDAFRSSLSPKIVQALICAQDWLRMDSKPINVEDNKLIGLETILP
ncbi:UNVERIFIED_CONTAM: putative AC transposase [Sesamum angustifolium]|uniref:AC transposase n=1 Tax=Sesamum angustifolium TaxID=2727405 RepID=A0AAW2MU82_9LAMI